jgi:alkanesulfonate monooxygenase SsuD/methylene tetrahydromethanopterin reductase-like flavin-dependent oxidoreductase (luciferase family)
MRYGFYLPTRGPTATRDGVLTLAREGERLGFHSAMVADHIVFPVESRSTYPYTLDGKHPSVGDALDAFSILGVVAGATQRLRLVTSVLVLPYRNPVLTAKMGSSLDILSGGRLTLGVGAGWLKEEFEALNSPAFEARGAVTDEWIATLKQLWSQSPASFDGRFYPVLGHPLRTVSDPEAAPADLRQSEICGALPSCFSGSDRHAGMERGEWVNPDGPGCSRPDQ